ncbi:hypothetical protein M8C21_006652 [Ambrosia artemisiifolia]|uniref:Uncharacterized protein n=1 Tax=Ambrosia artemisiifolia TaxID=4212 RepID=A0AAD5CT20_AMBAR|nr:hypothetical protein M8C21_006652 [Ambrosia artemisiifolia]
MFSYHLWYFQVLFVYPPDKQLPSRSKDLFSFCFPGGLESIYINGLPTNAKPAFLEEELKNFRPIKPNGIQVRSNRNTYQLIILEFEVLDAVEKVIELSLPNKPKFSFGVADIEANRKRSHAKAMSLFLSSFVVFVCISIGYTKIPWPGL